MPNKHVRVWPGSDVADIKENGYWVDRELADCTFQDERLGKRLRALLSQLSSAPGGSIPLACRDCAHVRHAVITIREKWRDICTEQGWEYLPIALPHSVMKLVLELQHAQLEKYRADSKGEGRKKK